MTIEKGRPWGRAVTVPIETRDVGTDADLACGTPGDIHVLTGGDLHRALGAPPVPRPGQERTLVHIDALRCEIETRTGTRTMRAASAVQVGKWLCPPWHRRRHVVVTNGGIVARRNVAPRAHPNDGLLHVVTLGASMPWRQRLTARRRAESGNHLPHPHIVVDKAASVELIREHPHERLVIDGAVVRNWERARISVEPDCWQVIV